MSEQIADESVEVKPLVTFALFAYNQQRYVREAIAAAFAQNFHLIVCLNFRPHL